MNQSFNMGPAAVTGSKRKCVPPCEVEEMTKEQQAVVDRYLEQQDANSKSVPEQTDPKLVYSAEQRKALELLASVNCPVEQRDTVW